MTRRLGNVIYWGCSGLAAIIVLIGAYGARTIGGDYDFWTLGGALVAAAIVWLIGKASRYVLAGN
jgi:hypothetical protein